MSGRFDARGIVMALCLAGTFALLQACAEDPPTSLNRSLDGAGKPSSANPTVTATDPQSAPQDTTLDVRVLGSNLDRGSKAELALDCETGCVISEKVKANSTRFVNEGELVANITIAADADTALYDVLVTTSKGKRGIGIELFAVRLKSGRGGSGETALYTIVLTGDIQNDPAHPMTNVTLDPANPFANITIEDAWLSMPAGSTTGVESVCDEDGRNLGATSDGWGGFQGSWRGDLLITWNRTVSRKKRGDAHLSFVGNQQDANSGYINGVVNDPPIEGQDLSGNPRLTFENDRWWISATSWHTGPSQPEGVDRCVSFVITAVPE